MKKNTVIIAVGLIALILAIVGVVASQHKTTNKTSNSGSASTSGSSSQTPSVQAVATDTVTLSNYMFSPAAITVKAGTKVTWTNKDAVTHTVTSDDSSSVSFKSGNITDGGTYSFTFDTAGTYTYHCMPHPYMHGTVVVTN